MEHFFETLDAYNATATALHQLVLARAPAPEVLAADKANAEAEAIAIGAGAALDINMHAIQAYIPHLTAKQEAIAAQSGMGKAWIEANRARLRSGDRSVAPASERMRA